MSEGQPKEVAEEMEAGPSGRHDSSILLDVRELTTEFRMPGGAITANKNVSLEVERGKTLGIVGESGSGKSVFCRSILRRPIAQDICRTEVPSRRQLTEIHQVPCYLRPTLDWSGPTV
jgi:ABC-type glutathione transport system ATPase component